MSRQIAVQSAIYFGPNVGFLGLPLITVFLGLTASYLVILTLFSVYSFSIVRLILIL